LIGLDECFLKGPYKRHLLSDVARDANDNMYLICVVVLESECKSSWSWFLDALLKDIKEIKGGWTFISNRQKVICYLLCLKFFKVFIINCVH
jgi:hypothetical protein